MRRILTLLLTIVLFSCAEEDTNSYTLEGNAYGFADGTPIYVYAISDSNQPQLVDTLTINNEKFKGTFPKTDEVQLRYLNLRNPNANIIYFPENEPLKANIYRDSLQASYVTGSRQNEVYSSYNQRMSKFNDTKRDLSQRFQKARQEQDNMLASQIQQENMVVMNEEANYKKQFIRENNNSLFSVMLATDMLKRKELTAMEASEFVDNLPPKIAASPITADLKKTVTEMKRSDVGGQAPDFQAPTPSGEMLSLKDAMGKYTLIDFWASWCKPCRIENPNVVRVYRKYHDKGFNIISVSLDREGQKDRWIKAIADDNMDWYHVSNLKFWQDPIAQTYNVRSIPATFLIDENGTIVAKNLRGPALEAKVASLFDN